MKKTPKDKFEDICRRSGVVPKEKVVIDGKYIYIADGYRNNWPEHKRPAYRTVFAIGFGDDKLDVAQDLYFNFGEGTTLHSRINAAIKAAQTLMNDMKAAGRREYVGK